MKQVLITAEQLNKVVGEVNANILSNSRGEKKDFAIDLLLTLHTTRVMFDVCNILFGKEENNEKKTDSKKIPRPED